MIIFNYLFMINENCNGHIFYYFISYDTIHGYKVKKIIHKIIFEKMKIF